MNFLKFFGRKRQLDREFERELEFHIEELIQKNLADGMTAQGARRHAALEFGGKDKMTEDLRTVHSLPVIETAAANLKFAMRLIRKSPAFSAAIILTLALGIGANSAVFSVVNAILLRPLPFPNADELMQVWQYTPRSKDPQTFAAPRRLEDWNRMNSTFQALTGYFREDDSEVSGPLPEKVTHAFVAPRFLQVWGVSPLRGRDFTAEEELYGGPSAILISDRFWQKRFDRNPNAVGSVLRFAPTAPGHRPMSYTIVGVMSPSFLFPDREADLWSPSAVNAPYAQDRSSTWYQVIGRLKQGVTIEQARADLNKVQTQLGIQFPATDSKFAVSIVPLKEKMVGDSRRSLWILFGSVTLLLLIACTNIAALLLARMTEREHEISLRFSLGASRRVVVAQLLTETFILALLGSLAGLGLATSSATLFRTFTPNLPRVEEITLDWRLVSYCLASAIAVTFLCGVLPALRGTRGDLAGSLAKGSKTQVSGRNPTQWALVGVQVALAVTLLIGAGLLQRSLAQLARVSPGFDPDRVLTLEISESYGETADMKALRQRSNRILDTLGAVPGVEAAADAATLPGVPGQQQTELQIIEGEQDPNRKIIADSRFVSTGYFDVMRIPVLTGESCHDSSETTQVVVNRSFANTYLGQEAAIGHHVKTSAYAQFALTGEIRGVVADAREQGLNTEPMPTVYWCSNVAFPGTYFLIRTRTDPATLTDTLRRSIHEIEPNRSVFDVQPLERHLSASFAGDRLRTTLLSLFAITAVSLACLGLYGTLSYFVNVRRREVGLRLALGALRHHIAWRFLLQGLRVCAVGCACGLVLAAASVRVLSGVLYGVSGFDAATFTAVICLVFMVSAIATLAPAVRAARIDPMRVLREE
ncbi:MAG TPA: ABC transporter permease [Terriglobales bacterium]|nr:ABC transporter permease [Terriglobales bacterium]